MGQDHGSLNFGVSIHHPLVPGVKFYLYIPFAAGGILFGKLHPQIYWLNHVKSILFWLNFPFARSFHTANILTGCPPEPSTTHRILW